MNKNGSKAIISDFVGVISLCIATAIINIIWFFIVFRSPSVSSGINFQKILTRVHLYFLCKIIYYMDI